ncbi:MAG: hypothetical protein ACXAB7_23400 [Candidatus Kariarchaeaceae archaeon]|jgi:hypothetical protein
MASGDLLFVLTPQSCAPPSANAATIDWIPDASTPNMQIPVLDFDGAADEHKDWFVTIPPQYSEATGFTFSYKYAMDGTDGDAVEMEFRVLHIDDLDTLTGDLGIDTQTEVAITDDPAATANNFNYSGTGALAKANFGSAAPGDRICIRATRDVSFATNTDDLQLAEVLVKET